MTKLTQRFVMHMRLAKGGWTRGYDILDGDKVVGTKSVGAATRLAEATACYTMTDGEEHATAAQFLAAYEAKKKETA